MDQEKKLQFTYSDDSEDDDSAGLAACSANRVWTEEEDKILMETVKERGCAWKEIISELSSRGFGDKSTKQCRERWRHHVNPGISKEHFTVEEQRIIFVAHKENGNKWVDIAKLLPGRSDNQIKNFFYCKLRKVIRKLNKEFKLDDRYKKLHINESILFKLMKSLDASLAEVIAMPIAKVGDYLLQTRRRKNPAKRSHPQDPADSRVREVKKLREVPPNLVATPVSRRERQEGQTSEARSVTPFQPLCQPQSPFLMQDPMMGPSMSPPNFAAYCYPTSMGMPNTGFLAFQDYQVSPSPQYQCFQCTPPQPSIRPLSTPSPLMFNYQPTSFSAGFSGNYQSPLNYMSLLRASPRSSISQMLTPQSVPQRDEVAPQPTGTSGEEDEKQLIGGLGKKHQPVPALNLESITN